MSKSDVLSYIKTSKNPAILTELVHAADRRRKSVSRDSKHNLRVGASVKMQWSANETKVGIIKRINRSKCEVIVDGHQWSVPISIMVLNHAA